MNKLFMCLKEASSGAQKRHCVLCMMIVFALLTGCSSQYEPDALDSVIETVDDSVTENDADSSQSAVYTENSSSDESKDSSGESADVLKVQVLKVGKADAMVLTCGESTMIIDCGEEEDGLEVLKYLEGQGISEVDVLMITHFDKDHVGGADTVVEGIPVKRVILPSYAGTGTDYMDFMAALDQAGITPENVTENIAFDLGCASVLVEPPASYEIPEDETEYDNNFSLITTVLCHGKRLVFTGDIQKQRIREWLAGSAVTTCDVLKVPHHGVYNTSLEELFKTLSPKYAVICDSKKNMADERTIELLKQCGADCLETCYGDITILCSESGLEIHQLT